MRQTYDWQPNQTQIKRSKKKRKEEKKCKGRKKPWNKRLHDLIQYEMIKMLKTANELANKKKKNVCNRHLNLC